MLLEIPTVASVPTATSMSSVHNGLLMCPWCLWWPRKPQCPQWQQWLWCQLLPGKISAHNDHHAHHSYNQDSPHDAQDDSNTQRDHCATKIATPRVPTMAMVPSVPMISKVARMTTVPAMKMVPWCSWEPWFQQCPWWPQWWRWPWCPRMY